MKKILSASISILGFFVLHAQNVGVGTNSPKSELHLHSGSSSFALQMTNNITSDAANRGFQLRMLGGNMFIQNHETGGSINFNTNNVFNTGLSLQPNGCVNIGSTSALGMMNIDSRHRFSRGINIEHTNGDGIHINVDGAGFTPSKGIYVKSGHNYFLPVDTFSIGIHAVAGINGASDTNIVNNTYGIIGDCRSPYSGFGVLGISRATLAFYSNELNTAGVQGVYAATDIGFGVSGYSNGLGDGAGVLGITKNYTAGLMGKAYTGSFGPAIKSVSLNGSSQVGLELENGSLKVSGEKRTAFVHTAYAGNITLNRTAIPNTGYANSPTDMLFVTPRYEGVNVYCNFPIGVWFNNDHWEIFNQNGSSSTMPLNASFNVLVIKQ